MLSIKYYLHKIFIISILSIIFLIFTDYLSAHQVTAVSVVSKFDTKGRRYSIELAMDIYPSEDPAVNDKVSPQQAADFFSTEALMLFFGDTQIEPQTKSELFKDPEADPDVEEQKVKVLVTLFGKIPKKAGYFTLQVSPDTTAAVVMVTFLDGVPGRRAEVLYPGEFSSPVDVAPVVEGDPFEAAEAAAAGGKKQGEMTVGEEDQKLTVNPEQGGMASMGYFFELGIRSFFSGRYEALLLVLCLFFFNQKLKDLLWQVIAFSIVRFTASAMAVFGMVSLSGMSGVSGLLFNWLIPLGVIALALGSLFSEELSWWRIELIALLGFLIGTVFSITLSIAALNADSVFKAFIGYNLGIELGQLLTLGAAGLVVMAFWDRDWYRRSISMPVSVLIAGVGFYWIISNVFFGG